MAPASQRHQIGKWTCATRVVNGRRAEAQSENRKNREVLEPGGLNVGAYRVE